MKVTRFMSRSLNVTCKVISAHIFGIQDLQLFLRRWHGWNIETCMCTSKHTMNDDPKEDIIIQDYSQTIHIAFHMSGQSV